MNDAVFITCAITGSGDSAGRSPHVPVTPAEIAESALEAHRAGAAIVHLHVRDPDTGKASRDPALFRELYERIREQSTDVILNFTGGMGGDLLFGPEDRPLDFATGTDFVGPLERIAHVLALRPELGTIDCGSLNFDESLYGTTPSFLRQMLRAYREKGVRPEVEVFELGHIELAKELMKEGLLDSTALFQLCLGIRFGAPATPESMLAMHRALPPDVTWSGFGVGRMQMPMVAQTVLLGGNPRVGLEDNLYLDKGVFATNGQLVERAVRIVESLGSRVLSASETRARLGFKSPFS